MQIGCRSACPLSPCKSTGAALACAGHYGRSSSRGFLADSSEIYYRDAATNFSAQPKRPFPTRANSRPTSRAPNPTSSPAPTINWTGATVPTGCAAGSSQVRNAPPAMRRQSMGFGLGRVDFSAMRGRLRPQGNKIEDRVRGAAVVTAECAEISSSYPCRWWLNISSTCSILLYWINSVILAWAR